MTTASLTKPIDLNTYRAKSGDFLDELDPQLATIWTEMLSFCSLLNASVHKEERPMTVPVFMDCMGSIMYHLVPLSFEMSSLDETVRLGLVAFSGPIFLEWPNVKLHNPGIAHDFRRCLASLEYKTCNVRTSPQLFLWLSMIGAISIFQDSADLDWLRTWMQPILVICNITTWNQMRDELKSFLWVSVIYDQAGQQFFETINFDAGTKPWHSTTPLLWGP